MLIEEAPGDIHPYHNFAKLPLKLGIYLNYLITEPFAYFPRNVITCDADIASV